MGQPWVPEEKEEEEDGRDRGEWGGGGGQGALGAKLIAPHVPPHTSWPPHVSVVRGGGGAADAALGVGPGGWTP